MKQSLETKKSFGKGGEGRSLADKKERK